MAAATGAVSGAQQPIVQLTEQKANEGATKVTEVAAPILAALNGSYPL